MTARRVGLVVHGQPPELVGGTERLVAGLAASLVGAGHAVEVFSGSIEWRPRFEVVRDEGGPAPVVRVHRSDLFFERWDKVENPHVERAYRDWLDAYRPDLVHVHHWARLTTNLVALARARGLPVVVSLHDLFPSCPRYHRVKEDLSFCTERAAPEVCRHCAPRWRFQGDDEIDASVAAFAADLRRELELADARVAPTAGHGRRLLEWMGLDLPVDAIAPPAGAVPRPARRPLGEAVATPERPLAVGVFGHLHPLKGVEVLLDAQARLPDPARVRVHVWGAAPTDEMDAALRARAGDRPVVWHGAYGPDDLADAPLDAVVLPTLCAESYSFALDEAAALGVPVLASDLGSLADRATDRVALFPRGDADALASGLLRLADDPARRASLAAAPPPATIDADAHVEALLAVYERVLAAPRGAPPPPDDLARREHAFDLREAGLGELLRSEGWEDVVAALRAELDAARRGDGTDEPC